jgi:50S ribosomal subunit-associated GTPase HflX
VLNKSDLVRNESLPGMIRHAAHESGQQAIAISALHRDSIRPLLEAFKKVQELWPAKP